MGGESTASIIFFPIKSQTDYITEMCDEIFLARLFFINVMEIDTVTGEQVGVAVVQ
jgi:hypothetical protein